MEQRALIYTTTNSQFFKEDLPFVVDMLNKTPGRTVTQVDCKTIAPPDNPMTFRDGAGDVRFVWDWFQKTFTDPAREDGYNVVIFHITPYYKKKWGLSKDIGGSYRNDPDEVMEFWFSSGRGDNARNYEDMSDAARKLIHEWCHGDSYFAGTPLWWKGSARSLVHEWDYDRHAIHKLPALFSYRTHNIQLKIIAILRQVVALYNK